MSEKPPLESTEQLSAGGFSNGELILIPDVKNGADTFMILFHEIGHNLDAQHDITSSLKPISEIKQQIITFTPEEAAWMLDESKNHWPTTGISEHHLSIMQKILDVILVEGTVLKRKVKSSNVKDFNQVIARAAISGSKTILDPESPQEAKRLEITDKKVHRNLETPADFISIGFLAWAFGLNCYFLWF